MRNIFNDRADGFSARALGGSATLGETWEGVWIGDPAARIEMPETGPRLDSLSADFVVNRWRNRDFQQILELDWTATPEEVEAVSMVDLVFGVPPRFDGHQDEDSCPGRLNRFCPKNPDACPNSTFMCPVPMLTRSEYHKLFPWTGPGMSTMKRGPWKFLGLDSQRTIGELRPSIENTIRLYRAIQSSGAPYLTWLMAHQAPVSQIAQGDVSMPRSFMDMEVSLILLGAPFTLTGLGVPLFLPEGVEVTWADVAVALSQIMTRDELIQIEAELTAVGAAELSDEINGVIVGGGGVQPTGNGDSDIPPVGNGDQGVPPSENDVEPIISGNAVSLLIGGGVIAAALALS